MLKSPDRFPDIARRRLPRQLRHFSVQNEISIHFNATVQQNVVEVMTLDRPGLLARIGALFMQNNIEIHSARIATLGERAEDVFFVTQQDGQPLHPEQIHLLHTELQQSLDEAAST